MVNSIQLQGLTYVRSLATQTADSKVEGEDFDSVLKDEIASTQSSQENSDTGYTNPADLVCVDSPSSLETYFQEASDTYGVPIALIKAVAKAESNFNTHAVSGAGASGIMQLMPGTANGLGVSNVFDAKENIMGGTKYLAQMLTKYNGSVKLALAAYNAGSGNVDKYAGVPPFSETQNYIKKIFGYLGVDSTGKTDKNKETETGKEDSTTQASQTSSTGLSSDDIDKLAKAILEEIRSKNTTTTASDLYSQLYGKPSNNTSNANQMLDSYSSIISGLLNSQN
ncbi:MAG: lytic transglycosylase domain-containing protein [Clostridium sp.]|nr:lytic transglycosylase domain-containing protein [Clostridium sp.]